MTAIGPSTALARLGRRLVCDQWKCVGLLWLIVAIGAIPRVYLGLHQYIEYDGYWHVFIARQPSWEGFRSEYLHNAHPPLYFLLLKLATLWDSSRLAYRAVSILAGLGSIFLVGGIVGRLSRRPAAGLLAALAMAGSSAAIEISLEVRSYMLCVFFLLVAFCYYLEVLRADPDGRRRSVIGFVAFSILALLSHYGAVFYLVAAAFYPVSIAAVNREYRSVAVLFIRKRGASLVMATLLVTATAGFLYFTQARAWTTPLNHLPDHYFQPDGGETIRAFLMRNAHNTVNLFSPVGVTKREDFLSIVVPLVLLALLAVYLIPCHRRREDVQACAPLAFSVLILGGVMAASVAGWYPFGGALRQQFFLVPFMLIAAVIFLDRLLARLGSQRFSRWGMALCGVAVVASSMAQLGARPVVENELFLREIESYRAGFPHSRAVYLGQFNLIGFFIHHHEWKWYQEGPWAPPPTIQDWRLEKDGKRITVYRDRSRWTLDLLDESLYVDLAAFLRSKPSEEIAVFFVKQFNPPWPSTGEFRDRVTALAARHSLVLRKLVVEGPAAYAALALLQPSTANYGALDSPGSLTGQQRGEAFRRLAVRCPGEHLPEVFAYSLSVALPFRFHHQVPQAGAAR